MGKSIPLGPNGIQPIVWNASASKQECHAATGKKSCYLLGQLMGLWVGDSVLLYFSVCHGQFRSVLVGQERWNLFNVGCLRAQVLHVFFSPSTWNLCGSSSICMWGSISMLMISSYIQPPLVWQVMLWLCWPSAWRPRGMGRNQLWLNPDKTEWVWVFDSPTHPKAQVICHLWLWTGCNFPRLSW